MTEAAKLRFHIEWEPSSGIATPELAETWARLSIWAGDRCITNVEDRTGSFRRFIYVSAYPLAEWIAYNWWSIISEVRPSNEGFRHWTWDNNGLLPWLRRHNLRAAGNGMPWPDLTLVQEGTLIHATWREGRVLCDQPVAFVGEGAAFLNTTDTISELSRFVDAVIDRLKDADVADTPLTKEWEAIRESDEEEGKFARAAARMGLDPYNMDEKSSSDLIKLAEDLPSPLLEEFLDSADLRQAARALDWLSRARLSAGRQRRTGQDLSPSLLAATDAGPIDELAPWSRGYEFAKELRRHLSVAPTDRLDMDALVSTSVVQNSAGLLGLTVADPEKNVALVLPNELAPATSRFAQARALGLAVFGGQRREFLLDPARTDLSKASRAFAAELVAPAEGIAEMMASLPAATEEDAAIDAIADRFGVNSLLVHHQFENQLLH